MLRIKKTANAKDLTIAEQRRCEEIQMIQAYLAKGYAPGRIRDILKTSYARIRKYATGDAYELCRFNRAGGSQLDRFREDIVGFLNQNLPKNKIFEQLLPLGYNGKMTALKDFCNKLIQELQIQYTPKRNAAGAAIKPAQKPTVHTVTRQDLLKHLWSEKPLSESDLGYLSERFPILTEIRLCISHFIQIFTEKNQGLLDWFVALYTQSIIKPLASFARGLSLDIAAVGNAVISPLSNGFVEGNNNRIKAIKRSMYGRAKIEIGSKSCSKVILG
jgi:hypothetical protein